MSVPTIEQRCLAVLVNQLGCDLDELKPEATFLVDLSLDSLDAIEAIMALEEEFGIEIPDEDSGPFEKHEAWGTVQMVVDYIQGRVKA